jgi:hypothetical protein
LSASGIVRSRIAQDAIPATSCLRRFPVFWIDQTPAFLVFRYVRRYHDLVWFDRHLAGFHFFGLFYRWRVQFPRLVSRHGVLPLGLPAADGLR